MGMGGQKIPIIFEILGIFYSNERKGGVGAGHLLYCAIMSGFNATGEFEGLITITKYFMSHKLSSFNIMVRRFVYCPERAQSYPYQNLRMTIRFEFDVRSTVYALLILFGPFN